MRRTRRYKPAYSENTAPVEEWGNGLKPDNEQNVKTFVASYQEDMDANDQLPEKLRIIINSTPNIKWSSVRILEALNGSKKMWPFLSEAQLIDQLCETIQMKDTEAGEALKTIIYNK